MAVAEMVVADCSTREIPCVEQYRVEPGHAVERGAVYILGHVLERPSAKKGLLSEQS